VRTLTLILGAALGHGPPLSSVDRRVGRHVFRRGKIPIHEGREAKTELSRSFTLVVERDPETGWLIGEIVELPSYYARAPDLPRLNLLVRWSITPTYTQALASPWGVYLTDNTTEIFTNRLQTCLHGNPVGLLRGKRTIKFDEGTTEVENATYPSQERRPCKEEPERLAFLARTLSHRTAHPHAKCIQRSCGRSSGPWQKGPTWPPNSFGREVRAGRLSVCLASTLFVSVPDGLESLQTAVCK